jgi:hypothetical protein
VNTGPLRRLVGTAGLLVLAPTAVMLVLGAITPLDAAIRAVATLVVTVIVGRVATWWLSATAASFERADTEELPSVSAAPEPAEGPRRRRTDHPAP